MEAPITLHDQLVAKLAHPLAEVRTRAFRSLVTKFTGGIPGWAAADLAADRALLASAVGWFSEGPGAAGDLLADMLRLVGALAQDAAASATLVELGSIPFFRAYKEAAPPDHQPAVQAILDGLLRVPVEPSPAITPSTSPDRVAVAAKGALGAQRGPVAAQPSSPAPPPAPRAPAPAPDLALCARIAQYCRTADADGCRFPLVSLCREDEVLLSDLTVRLYRQVPREAVDACLELEHALLHDFPAEVVLQRPALFQALVSLVQTPNHTNDLTVDLAAISALTALLRNARHSLRAYAAANLTAGWRFNREEPEIGQVLETLSGDRPEEAAAPPTYPAVPSSERGASGEGLSLSQACRCIVGEVLPLLRDAQRVAPVFQLLREALPLLKPQEPAAAAVSASDDVEAHMLSQFMHAVAKVMDFHGEALASDPVLSQIIMVVVALLELTSPDAVSTEVAWPEGVMELLGNMLLNENFCGDHPTFRARATPYLQVLQPTAARRYAVAVEVRQQLDRCIALFSERQTPFAIEDLHAVVDASQALRYRCDPALVANFVLVCADLSAQNGGQTHADDVRTLLLSALSSPVTALRGHSYAALHQLLKMEQQSPGRLSVAQSLMFHRDFMRQLVLFALNDKQLGTIPASLLVDLTSTCDAKQLSAMIAPVIAALQGAVATPHSGGALSDLLDAVQPQLTSLDRLKANVQMLFHNDARRRAQAAADLCQEFPAVAPGHEDASSDPFKLDGHKFSLPGLHSSDAREHQPWFEESDVCSVIDVFTQSALTSQLRRSAAGQLLSLCQDERACSVLYHHSVWARLWDELADESALHAVCLGLVMAIVERLPDARDSFRADATQLQTVLRFGFHAEPNVRAISSRTLALALFQIDVLAPENSTQCAGGQRQTWQMDVPDFVEQNFSFCFPVVSSSAPDEAANVTSPDAGITAWLNSASSGSGDAIAQAVEKALLGLRSSTSLVDAMNHLDQLHELCSASGAAAEAVLARDWVVSCVRYLRADPASLSDYKLVGRVLELASLIMCGRSLDEDDLHRLRTCVEGLVGLLGGLSDVLDSLREDDPAIGWLHCDMRLQTAHSTGATVPDEHRATVQHFREAVLNFIAEFILCEQRSSPGSPTTASLLVEDTSFLSVVCTQRFPGCGSLAVRVRSAALRCMPLVLRGANGCNNDSEISACLNFCRSVVCAAAPTSARYVDGQLYRVAMDCAGQCLRMLDGSPGALNEEFVAAILEIMGKRDAATRTGAVTLLRHLASSSASRTEHLKTEWENMVSFFGLGTRMVSVALNAGESFDVRSECLRVLADAMRHSVRMHDGSLHDGVANRHLTEHGLMSGDLELDTFHRALLTECVQLLALPSPPKFGGRLCDVLLWSALAFDRDALGMFCDDGSTWTVLLRRLSVSEHWRAYTAWQQATAQAQCAPVSSRADWLVANADDIASAAASTLQLMRVMVLGERSSGVDEGGRSAKELVEATVILLAEVFDARSAFDDEAFAVVHQAACELLSVLLARSDDATCKAIRQALNTAVGRTIRTSARRDGSALADALTVCMLSALPELEVAVCQFLDMLVADANDLLALHMSSTQCRELTTALTAAHIEGPLRSSNAEDGDALAAHCEKWTSSVRGALGQLVAWSHDAKVAALDAGLLGATIESLHTLHDSAQLKLLHADEEPAAARQAAMSSITAQLELLTNLLHHSADAKIAAADAACLQIQRKLWTLQAQQPEPAFTTQLLRVAAASVSHCAEAQAWWHERLVPTEHNADARCVVSAAIRLAKKRQVTTGVWLAAVGALRNFALVKSARLHMLKEGWLNHCATLLSSIGTAERAKEQPSAEALCQFLANFAFAADGQSGCLKVSGMLPAVVGTLRCPRVETQRAAALALRNTCFLRTNKAHFLADPEVLPALGRALLSEDAPLRLYAASALWALVYDNQKAKSAVKQLIARGEIRLAPAVVAAARKPIDPAVAAAAAVGEPAVRAAYCMLQVARLLQ